MHAGKTFSIKNNLSCHILHTDSLPVPVKIFVEHRNNSRVSLASDHIIIRLPHHISGEDKNKRIREHIAWAQKQLQQKDHYRHKQRTPGYYQQLRLRIMETDFTLQLHTIETGRNRISYRGDQIIHIFLLKGLPEKKQVTEIQRLLIKFAEKYCLPYITQRTHHFNALHFREKIEKVRLNHTTSKWGSCSAKRHIMFSTKLLLLPLAVIDYVIIHELAHLKELNHSDRFWSEVQSAMPDYKKWDRWLTKNGMNYDY
jgi:predicted metal-dependent hydrolase